MEQKVEDRAGRGSLETLVLAAPGVMQGMAAGHEPTGYKLDSHGIR